MPNRTTTGELPLGLQARGRERWLAAQKCGVHGAPLKESARHRVHAETGMAARAPLERES
eukprot:8689602-Pyramimonas_sp.AAC.1